MNDLLNRAKTLRERLVAALEVCEKRTPTEPAIRATILALDALTTIIRSEQNERWIHGRPSPAMVATSSLAAILDLWT
jgi:hypothetical protein